MGNNIKVEKKALAKLISYPEEIQLKKYKEALGLSDYYFGNIYSEIKLRTLFTNDIIDELKLSYIISKIYGIERLQNKEKDIELEKLLRDKQKKEQQEKEEEEILKNMTIGAPKKIEVYPIGQGIKKEETTKDEDVEKPLINFQDFTSRFKSTSEMQGEVGEKSAEKQAEKDEEIFNKKSQSKQLEKVEEEKFTSEEEKNPENKTEEEKKEEEKPKNFLNNFLDKINTPNEEEEKVDEKDLEYKRKTTKILDEIKHKKEQCENVNKLFKKLLNPKPEEFPEKKDLNKKITAKKALSKRMKSKMYGNYSSEDIGMILFLLCQSSELVLSKEEGKEIDDRAFFMYSHLKDYNQDGLSKELLTDFCKECFRYAIKYIIPHMMDYFKFNGQFIHPHFKNIYQNYEDNLDKYANGFVSKYLFFESNISGEKLDDLFQKNKGYLNFENLLLFIIKMDEENNQD